MILFNFTFIILSNSVIIVVLGFTGQMCCRGLVGKDLAGDGEGMKREEKGENSSQ